MVLKETVDPISKLKGAIFIPPNDFKIHHSNESVTVGRKSVKVGHAWIESPNRRTYEGVIFAPDGAPANYYNFWQGFTVVPRSGDISKYLDHIR